MTPRPLLLLVVPIAAGAFVVGSTVRSDPTPDRTLVGGGALPSGTVAAAYTGTDLQPADSCTDLLARYVERGVDEVGPWGWGYGSPGYVREDGVASDSDGAVRAPLASSATEAGTVRQTNGATGTNVQEAGVDEPDRVKTDGSTLFRIDGGNLVTYDVTGPDVVRLGSIDLPRMSDAEILLAGSTVVAIAADEDGETTRTAVIDVSDPAAPLIEHTTYYDTHLVTARLHGTGSEATVRLVLQAGPPDLDLTGPGTRRFRFFDTSQDDATRANQDVVRSSTIEDWLPHVSTDGGDPRQLLDCEDVGLPDEASGLGTVAVVGFTASDPLTTSTTGLAAGTEIAYASTDRLYLATSAVTPGWSACLDCVASPTSRTAGDGTTHLHAFELAGIDTTYVASGEVDGIVSDRWSIDEHDGVVRLAVGASARTDRASSVVTLAEDGDELVEEGRLDGLGPDEEIRSVRWFDTLAIVVTFRQTDPLYAVDLTDPSAPTLLGELKIPGFSAYLHPLGGHRMIGLGEGPGEGGSAAGGPGWGAQLGLFDVTDLTDPTRIALTHYGPDTYAAAASDPRQLTWLPDTRTVLTVVGDYSHSGSDHGWISVVHLDGGAMDNRMVELADGGDLSDVRLVPLPDARVVLATGDDASFLAL